MVNGNILLHVDDLRSNGGEKIDDSQGQNDYVFTLSRVYLSRKQAKSKKNGLSFKASAGKIGPAGRTLFMPDLV